MQTTTVSPTIGTTGLTQLQCVTGTVTLFRFVVQPRPGDIIGQIQPAFGTPIFLIQTIPSTIPISSVDGSLATLCGLFVRRGVQVVLDVRTVSPITPAPIPIPPFNNPLLLLLLLLLLLGGQGGLGQLSGLLSGQQGGLSNILGSLQGLLGTSGLSGVNLSSLLQTLTGQSQGI